MSRRKWTNIKALESEIIAMRDRVSRSGYYSFVSRLDKPEKDAGLADLIRHQQEKCFRTYGYRRMWRYLKNAGINRNPKTVLRIMKKYELLAEIRRRRKWVNLGQQVHKYENLLNRQFQSDRPIHDCVIVRKRLF